MAKLRIQFLMMVELSKSRRRRGDEQAYKPTARLPGPSGVEDGGLLGMARHKWSIGLAAEGPWQRWSSGIWASVY